MFFATDITNFLACQHIAMLNRAQGERKISKKLFADPGAASAVGSWTTCWLRTWVRSADIARSDWRVLFGLIQLRVSTPGNADPEPCPLRLGTLVKD